MATIEFASLHAPSTEKIRALITTHTTPLPHHSGDCSICLESFRKDSSRAVKTKCGHIFHDACLATWNEQSSSCPYCRQELYQARYYGVPFRHSEPFWLDEQSHKEWCDSEIGKEVVETFTVELRGCRWIFPAQRPEPVVERVVTWF